LIQGVLMLILSGREFFDCTATNVYICQQFICI
jgi:hypothetical protein